MTEASSHRQLTFSVIVASWRRERWLARCLTALRQLEYPAFEIVVVTDGESLTAVDATGLKTVEVSAANLSAARNAGLAVAGGDVCAFIDDDAVPEPLWLVHHGAALASTRVAASVGFVRGRNGISFQSRVASIDREAETHVEAAEGDAPFIPDLAEGRALKLVGTNAAIRRDILCQLGGFDEAFAYFLEDADISLRLAEAGHCAAVAPLAEVHHAFAPSPRRTPQRAPTDLFDIGRSSAIFFRRYPSVDTKELYRRIARRERTRLARHMVRGTCEPRDVARVLNTLELGWIEGKTAVLEPVSPMSFRVNDLLPHSKPADGHNVISSRLLRRRAALREAEQVALSGRRVSFFSFSLTPVRHHVSYTDAGVWSQTGGQFGRSERGGKAVRWCRFADRLKEEIRRVAKARGI